MADELTVPARPGVYNAKGFRVQVRRKRDRTVWLRGTVVRRIAEVAEFTKHGFCKASKVDVTYTGTRIWNARGADEGVSVREPTAKRILRVLAATSPTIRMEHIAFVTKDGEFYAP